MLKNEMKSYVRIGGRGFEKSYVPSHGVRGGVKNCQYHPYVINEWPLISSSKRPPSLQSIDL